MELHSDKPPLALSDILASEEVRHQEFPVTRSKLYFAHAAVCPLPARVTNAMCEYLQRVAQAGQFEGLHHVAEVEARNAAAGLLGVDAEEIAFVPSTSAGLSLVAAGLDWQPGDNVVVAEGDFPANVYPWLNLASRGVRVKFIPAQPDNLITLADVRQQLDEHTRVVSLSSIHFTSGAPVDVDQIGSYLGGQNKLFCVDAIQSFGAVQCSAREADFLVADGHKWLLGPQGMGILVVRRRAWERLQPPLVGWKSFAEPNAYHVIQNVFPNSARRYEPGSLNAAGLIGLQAALAIIKGVGIASIADRIQLLRSLLLGGLTRLGYSILGPSDVHLSTGITTFTSSDGTIRPLYNRLTDCNCVVSLRKSRQGKECLRLSPHFYNTEDEIHRFLELLGPAGST